MGTLTYNEYLFLRLLETNNYNFGLIEYDRQFEIAKREYKKFEDSNYNNPDENLYECIIEYLNDTEINLD